MKKAKPTDKELLELMKWYAEENIAFNKGKTFEEFQTTTQLNWASVFSIEQLAENSVVDFSHNCASSQLGT